MGIFAAEGKLAAVLNRVGELIVLNILTILCSLPIFTAGAAMTALYAVAMRLVRGEENKIVRNYLRAFHDNFKQATILWLIFGGIMLFMVFDIWVLQFVAGIFGQVYRILLFVLILLFAVVLLHAFAVLARFENTTGNTAKNALLFCVGHIGPACLMLAVAFLPVVLLAVSYRFVPVVLLVGVSGPVYLAGMYFVPLFRRYEGEDTAHVEGDGQP